MCCSSPRGSHLLGVSAVPLFPSTEAHAESAGIGSPFPQPNIQRFRNTSNGYEEEVGTPWIWCVLFGCIYFAVRGIWTHAVAAMLLALLTGGFSWLIYPLFARRTVQTHHLRRSWVAHMIGPTARLVG